MSEKTRKKLVRAREAGLVSIMITLILMIVVSLIVIGFAQISRRNQRQTLDRQLSAQAFYAAETGINDVRNAINAAVSSGASVPPKTSCGSAPGYGSLNPVIDAGNSVEYTCVLVDPSPSTLLYEEVGNTGIVVPLISASGANISTVTMTWQTSEKNNNTPTVGCPANANNVFSTTGSWLCGYGVLRFDLVPTTGSLTYSALQSNTMTSFAVPVTSGALNSVNFATGGGNNRLAVRCSDANCNLTINLTAAGQNHNQYYLRVQSLYKSSSALQITARDSGGAGLQLSGAQAVIDSTGKAQEVLRRVQVHVPLTNSSQNLLSDYGLQSTESICKRFRIMDNYFDSDVSGVISSNPLCRP